MCMEYAMLAEIFMLRAETAAREAAKDAARFVPITLPSTPTAPTRPTSQAHLVETNGPPPR